MSKNYKKKIEKSGLLSEKAKNEAEKILNDLEKIHKGTDQEKLKAKKEYIDFRMKQLLNNLKFN